MRNPNYHKAFQYLSPYIEDRNSYITDGNDIEEDNCYQSDLVRIVLNLAFLKEEDVKGFTFSHEECKKRYEQGEKARKEKLEKAKSIEAPSFLISKSISLASATAINKSGSSTPSSMSTTSNDIP